MAIAIDPSSPAIATQTNGATATVATASFTPPAGSTLLVEWSGNTGAGVDPGAPSVTDNLGVHLTYAPAPWSHRGDGPAADGQAAMWTAVVGSSPAMTVTVTNAAASGAREAALKVTVLTGVDTTTPVGASGKSGSTSAASIAQNYTAQATGGWGFLVATDWDLKGVQTAGTGTTRDGSANVSTAITYGFFRRTSPDDVNGNSNTINVTLGGTSTNVRWVYVEMLPAAGGATGGPAPVTVVAAPRQPAAGVALVTSTRDVTPIQAIDTPARPVVVAGPRRPGAGAVWLSRSGERVETVDLIAPVVVAAPLSPRAGVAVVLSGRADPPATGAWAPPAAVVLPSPAPRPGAAVVLTPRADPVIVPGDTVIPPEVVAAPIRPRPGVVLAPVTYAPQAAAPDTPLAPLVVAASTVPRPGAVWVAVPRERVEDVAPPDPVVVVPANWRRAGVVVLAQPAALSGDAVAPRPWVVVGAGVRPRGALVLSAPRTDPPVVVPGALVPHPLVVAAAVRPTPGVVWTRQPYAGHDCFVIRPDTGLLVPVDAGTVLRPDIGPVVAGGGIVVRPYTGIVENEC